jgi:hypothetical protein
MATRKALVMANGLKTEIPNGDVIARSDVATATKATASASAGLNITPTYIAPNTFVIPANGLAVGDVFRITAFGRCTSTVINLSTFVPRLGAAGTITDTSLGSITATAAASGTNIGFRLEITITVRAVGASGAVVMNSLLTNQGTTGISNLAVAVNGAANQTVINTTGQLILGLSYSSAAITTTTTFEQVIVEKLN